MTGELAPTLALLLLRRRLLPGSSGLSAAWQHSCWEQLGGRGDTGVRVFGYHQITGEDRVV